MAADPLRVPARGGGGFAAGGRRRSGGRPLGERFGDRDLFAVAIQAQGYMLIKSGQVREGLALLDEGDGRRDRRGAVADRHRDRLLRRDPRLPGGVRGPPCARVDPGARGLVGAAAGDGRVHRALPRAPRGDHAAGRRLAGRARGGAPCRRALRRRRGTRRRASRATARASSFGCRATSPAPRRRTGRRARFGWEPQPGLAQLRLAQGRTDAAVAAIRARRGGRDASRSTGRGCSRPSSRSCSRQGTSTPPVVPATSSRRSRPATRARCSAPSSRTRAARSTSRRASHARRSRRCARAREAWQRLDAPYEIARTRVLVGDACRALGDEESAALEHDAARAIFERLGARPDLARLSLRRRLAHGLSGRELEVLRLVAAGRTNREIAASLVISEHTVARHLQNIFAKLGVSSRAAATAFAFEHDLV